MVGLDSRFSLCSPAPNLPFSSPTPPPPACHCGKKGRRCEEMRGENRERGETGQVLSTHHVLEALPALPHVKHASAPFYR